MRHRLFLVLTCLPLAACTTAVDDPWLADRGQTSSIGGTQANHELPAEHATVHLAALDHAPIAVRRLSRQGARVEEIVYGNATTIAGENMLTVVFGDGDAPSFRKAPTREALAREMRAALPGIAMTTTPVLGSNAYGRFGSATGPLPGGGACVYAWQSIETLPTMAGQASGPAKIRLRYCQSGMTGPDLAGLLSSLSAGPGAARSISRSPSVPTSSSDYAYAKKSIADIQSATTVTTPVAEPASATASSSTQSATKAVATPDIITVPLPQ